ncbi:hypothetical protein [Streptomyces sp. CT34]|uniref:hypothetical protein n=1 Tax=Streptomyces sp. CT34 TaxID=1553907 RepID=UPI0006925C46|nr:hypothetical protein [Streptomyces sp. CT34]
MTNLTTVDCPQTRRVIRALSLPALIRLVSEIDDNGPISRRHGSLQSTFDDLTAAQLGYAIERARDFGLIYRDEDERVRYRLTTSGEDLAGVYDTAARWARTHRYPTVASDFVTRVQHALALLGQAPALARGAARIGDSCGLLVSGGSVLSLEALAALDGPETALAAWLQTNPNVLDHTGFRSSHAEDEWAPAA